MDLVNGFTSGDLMKTINVLCNNAGEFAALSGVGFVAGIFAIIVIVMCLLDSTPGPNKYGESPKYVQE